MGEAKRRKQLDPNFGLIPRDLPNLIAFPYYVKHEPQEVEEMGLPRPGEGVDCFLNKDALLTMAQLVSSEWGHSVDQAMDIVIERFGEKIFNERYFGSHA